MSKVKPRTLSGFMELTPPEQVYFNAMVDRLQDSFSLFGFTPLDTPLMEASEILLAKGGGETEKQIYTLSKDNSAPAQRDYALRYELTTSLAKYVTIYYNDLSFPFRRYEIGKVYRGERAQRGRFREFYQADIDIIGDGSLDTLCEAEIPSVIYKALTSLGLERFVIRINNRKVLSGFFEITGVDGTSSGVDATDIMRVIDKLDKIGADKVLNILVDEYSFAHGKAREIIDFVSCKDEPFEVLERYKGCSELFDTGIDELRALKSHMIAFGVPETHFAIDLSIARGLDYYTGSVYETFLLDSPEVGSICSGGRYDNLAECFTDRRMPGVGISIGLTRLFYILQEQKLLCDTYLTAPADVLIIPMTDDLTAAVHLAADMREAGLRTQIYSEDKKVKQKVAYADKLGIPFVVFLGEDELKSGLITVKDMKTGEQTTASAGILTAGVSDKIKGFDSSLFRT